MANFCNKCGNKLSPEANFCNRCGNRVIPSTLENNSQSKEKIEENKAESEQQELEKKQELYNKACLKMQGDKNNYIQAINYFQVIIDYKDSKEKIKDCEKEIEKIENENREKRELEEKQENYDKACAKMKGDRNSIIEAISIFDYIKTFKDSNDKIKDCQNIVKKMDEEKNEETYNNACNLMKNNFEDLENKSFTDKYLMTNIALKYNNEALNSFNSIKNYKDSEDKIKECEKSIEKLQILKKQYNQKIRLASLTLILVGLICYGAFVLIKPIYYRFEFDKIITNGDYGLIYRLSYNPDFREYSSDEQCKKVIDYLITNTKKDDLNAKYGIFDNPTFKKINNIILGQNNINSIISSFRPDNDIENRYYLLENPNFDKYGNKSIAEEQLRIITLNLTSNSVQSKYELLDRPCFNKYGNEDLARAILASISMELNNIDSKYELLDKPCFKKYGNEVLATTVVDSIYLSVKDSGIDEKLKLLNSNLAKPYLSETQRKELKVSLFKILEYLNDSQLDNLLLEISNKDDLEIVKDLGDKIPNNYINWLVDRTKSNMKLPNLTILNELLVNNESTKNIIALKASDLLKSNINYKDYKPDELETVTKTYSWAFTNNVNDLLEDWIILYDYIRETDKKYDKGGYSTIEKLKIEREEPSKYLYLTGYVIEFINYYRLSDGTLSELYRINNEAFRPVFMFTTKTSFKTTGRFGLYVHDRSKIIPKSLMEDLSKKYGFNRFCLEVDEYEYKRNRNKYIELTNEIERLEKSAKEYEEIINRLKGEIKSIQLVLLNRLIYIYDYKNIINEEKEREKAVSRLINVTQIELIKCPAGSFIMGSPENELGRENDETQHKVNLTKDFYIGKYEVKQKEYEYVMNAKISSYKDGEKPVEYVLWKDAKEFCNKLNSKYRYYLPKGYKFDLPTEAQWEYACRAGTSTALNNGKNLTSSDGYYNKDLNLDEVAWYNGNIGLYSTPRSVGQKRPNAWGIYDMLGNVEEWCRDFYSFYPNHSVTDYVYSSSEYNTHVFRGGGHSSYSRKCRSANRDREDISTYVGGRNKITSGFRIALVPED